MKKLFLKKKELSRILKLRKKLEKNLNLKLRIENNNLLIESKKEDSYSEYLSSKIIDAVSLGFELESAMQLMDINYNFIKIDIKNFVRESRLKEAISRVIGSRGKTKKLISQLSECDIVIHEHIVAAIGPSDNIAVVQDALVSLIRGSKPSKVYSFLERQRARLRKLAEENIELFIKKYKKL